MILVISLIMRLLCEGPYISIGKTTRYKINILSLERSNSYNLMANGLGYFILGGLPNNEATMRKSLTLHQCSETDQ